MRLDPTVHVKNLEGIIVHESPSQPFSDAINAEEEVEKARWVTRIQGSKQAGIYVYGPEMTKLIRSFKDMVRDLAQKQGFTEMIFPRHYSHDALSAFGWTNNDKLKYELMSINPLHPSSDRSNYDLVSDPLQCVGFYETLRAVQESHGGVLPPAMFDEPVKVYEEQGGWTLRNESTTRLKGGFATGFEFAGAEIVWAGKPGDCYNTRWNVLHDVISLIESLDLQYRIIVSGSCSRDAECPEEVGKEMALWEIPTLDIELFVPYLAEKGEHPWIEIGGGDIAGTRLTNNFGLQLEDGSPLYSGCQGVGWQRISYGLLSQKGMDPQNWKDGIQSLYLK